ncbi:MAG TPA: MGMT family protein [Bacteroidota bacterium]|jgi:methylated-DNA-protein-cysteine methyltransferase-like protein|nr:MGMT family protein [Bacteroidota bacterium]
MKTSSDSYLRIWQAVRKIPKGRVSTYGAIADVCRLWGQARLVGYALHNLPHGSEVPWQRVINAQGKISFPKNSDMYVLQRRLLRSEGIVFKGEKTSLLTYGWRTHNITTSQMSANLGLRRRRHD